MDFFLNGLLKVLPNILLTIYSLGVYPMAETTRVSFLDSCSILKLPSKSVVVPFKVPLTRMLTNGSNSFVFASLTTPEIFNRDCPLTFMHNKRIDNNVIAIFFKIFL